MTKIRIEPDMVAILLTDQCNAQCSMCCFSCSPQKKQVADEQVMREIIKQASAMPNIKKVGFSGGEAFLQYDSLLRLTKFASELGLRTSVTTNGFWAKSDEKTEEMLMELKRSGIGKIGLSLDHFHQSYVDVACLKRILRFGKKMNIPIDIGSVITKSTSDLSDLLYVVKDELVDITHYRAACLPIGRANCIDKSDFFYDEELLSKSIKCYELTYFSVYLDGSVYPCCSQAGMQDVLKIGNIHQNTLQELLGNYHMNMHIRMLKKYGFDWYLHIAEKENFHEFFEQNYVNKCHLCHTIFHNQAFLTVLSKYIEQERVLIYQKYMKENEK